MRWKEKKQYGRIATADLGNKQKILKGNETVIKEAKNALEN